MRKICVAGVGMIPFRKPGASESYHVMGLQAAQLALTDACITYGEIEQAYAGYVHGHSTCGQQVLYGLGMTGIPVFNVNNNCSSGSTALFLARQAIATGAAECVLALGFEEMKPGALGTEVDGSPTPFDKFNALTLELVGMPQLPMALRYFGGAGLSHMQKYGTTLRTFAKIRAKASRHAANNPLAVFRDVLSDEDVLQDKVIWPGVMTRLMACPPTCGAAAAVLMSDEFAKARGLRTDVVIAAQSMVTDFPSTFEARDMIKLVGFDMAREGASRVYESAGVGPEDIDLVELHDCFAQNELLCYEALGFCPEGGAEKFVDDGANTYGGQVVTNPSGGLLSKGHPLGATGLAQCYEITHQLRGTAGKRQVAGARNALQHNLGMGGACVVTLYQSA